MVIDDPKTPSQLFWNSRAQLVIPVAQKLLAFFRARGAPLPPRGATAGQAFGLHCANIWRQKKIFAAGLRACDDLVAGIHISRRRDKSFC